jgi:hypothetical protein
MEVTSLKFEWNTAAASQAKALFGSPCRIAVAAWILQREEPFYLQECQQALAGHGYAGSAVRKELQVYVDLELVSRYEDGRRVYFTALENRLWAAMRAIVESLTEVE